MLNQSQISAMRAAQNSTMPDTAVIVRRTLASDGAGGQVETWAEIASVSCRVALAGQAGTSSSLEAVKAGRLSTRTLYRVTLPALTDVTTADRLRVGVRVFEVTGVLPGGAWETARVCQCVEVA
jgi:head-tail adaptor